MSRSLSPCFQSLPDVTREELLALMDELGLIPSVCLTPTLEDMLVVEFREKRGAENFTREMLDDQKFFLARFVERSRRRSNVRDDEYKQYQSEALKLFPKEL